MSDPLADLRRSQDRDYASVGVCMFLTLRSEVDPIPVAAPPLESARLTRLVSAVAQSFAAGGGDRHVALSVLQAAAYREFDHSVLADAIAASENASDVSVFDAVGA